MGQKMAATANNNNSFVELTADGEVVSAAGGADCTSSGGRPDGCPCSHTWDCANPTPGCAFYPPGQKEKTTCGGKAPAGPTPGPPAPGPSPAGQCSGKDDRPNGCTCTSHAQCKSDWCHLYKPTGSNTCGGVNPIGPSPGPGPAPGFPGDLKIGTLVFMPNNSSLPDINEWDRVGAMKGRVGTVIAPIWTGWGGSDSQGLKNVS